MATKLVLLTRGLVSHTIYLSIYLTPEQQRLVANSLHFFLSIARYQASQRPVPSRSILLGPGSPGATAGAFLTRPRCSTTASPYCGPKRVVGGDTGLHASNMPKEGKSPPSDSRLDVLQACAVLHLQVCYVIEPADP